MKKPALIFVHGLRGDHYGLLEIADALRMDYNVITPDLPGYGELEALKEQTLDYYADWLHDFVAEQKLKNKPVIIGHSMGAILVSYYQTKYPDDTDNRTVYLSPIIRSKPQQWWSNCTSNLLQFFLKCISGPRRYRLLKSKLVALLISRYLTYDRVRQKYIDRQHFEHSGRFTSTKSVIADIELSMREQVTIEADKQILLCMGNHDRLVRVRNVKKRIAGKGNIQLEVVKGTGHLINYEQPKICAAKIREFLN